MRRLMSLREARGEEQEEDSDDRSSEERSEANPTTALGGEHLWKCMLRNGMKKCMLSYKRIYPGPAHFEFIDRRKYIDVSAHKRSFLSSKKSQTRWPDTAGHLQTFCFFHRKKISQNSDLTSIKTS